MCLCYACLGDSFALGNSLFTLMKLTCVGFCRCDMQLGIWYLSLYLVPVTFSIDSEHLFSNGFENYQGGPVELFKSFVVHKKLSAEFPSSTVLNLPEKMVVKILQSKSKISYCILGIFII